MSTDPALAAKHRRCGRPVTIRPSSPTWSHGLARDPGRGHGYRARRPGARRGGRHGQRRDPGGTNRCVRRRQRSDPRAAGNRGQAIAAERGVALEWREANAEDLPFGDNEFDAVVSSIGVMFAPHHQPAADELVRVL